MRWRKELHCAESAALVRNLATALDVQFARANALTVVDVCDPNVLAQLDEAGSCERSCFYVQGS